MKGVRWTKTGREPLEQGCPKWGPWAKLGTTMDLIHPLRWCPLLWIILYTEEKYRHGILINSIDLCIEVKNQVNSLNAFPMLDVIYIIIIIIINIIVIIIIRYVFLVSVPNCSHGNLGDLGLKIWLTSALEREILPTWSFHEQRNKGKLTPWNKKTLYIIMHIRLFLCPQMKMCMFWDWTVWISSIG